MLAFDVGSKRIGIAIAQNITKTATPLSIIANDNQLHNALQKLIKDYNPKALVVGYPLDVKGQKMSSMKYIEHFIEQLKLFSNAPIHNINECFTTKLAKNWCRENKVTRNDTELDDIAASIILNAWLHS